MNETELNELLDKHGYRLLKVIRFKNCDRIRWEHKSKDLHGSWTLRKGWHLERLKPEHIELIFPTLKQEKSSG